MMEKETDMNDDDADELEVARMAVEGLRKAQQKALASGHPIIIGRDGWLVRIENGQVTRLRRLPERKPVANRHLKLPS